MMKDITGSYLPGESILHRLDARSKLFGFIILIIAVILAKSPLTALVMMAAVAGLVLFSGMSPGMFFGPVLRLAPFFVIIFLMNALFFSSDDPIWHWGIFTLSEAGALQGASVIFRVALIIVMSSLLTTTTSPMDLMHALETLVKPLKLLRLPAEEIAMILSIAIQFIPVLLEESDTIRKAQIARGARFDSGKLREKAMDLLPMVVPLFLSAFRRADELSVAMEARGYRGASNRTAKERKAMDLRSWAALIVCAALCAAMIVLR